MRPPEKRFPRRRKKWILPDHEWLYDQYVTREKSSCRIGKEVGVSPGKIARWLDALEIPRRRYSEGVRKGSNSPFYKGPDSRSRGSAHRLVKELNLPATCAQCGLIQGRMEIHHADGNPHNNSPKNLVRLCGSCHSKIHWAWRKEEETKNGRVAMSWPLDPKEETNSAESETTDHRHSST
jgi:hypothetical protein